MKTIISKSVLFIMAVMLLMGTSPVHADKGNIVTVNGVVKTLQKKAIESASVRIKGTNISTVTNEDGEFVLKVDRGVKSGTLIVSHIGYTSSQYAYNESNANDITVLLTPKKNMLEEVIVQADVSQNIVRQAIMSIPNNYESKESLLTGFYRETVRKRSHFINISEAVIGLYKTSYKDRNADKDRVHIIKGRKLLSEKPSDTLSVKLQGGPNLSNFADYVKNPDDLLNLETLNNYYFRMEKSIYMDNRLQYVISFEPKTNLEYALYYGKLYIDKESLAFTRIETSLDMRDRNKVTQAILKKKPMGLNFKPLELSFVVDYKEQNGRMALSYVRNEVKFKCDWKKKLFHTEYTIVSEMAVTDMTDNDVEKISYKESFKDYNSLSDKVSSFYDENYWGAYNIIAPTESLDKAVKKIARQNEKLNDNK